MLSGTPSSLALQAAVEAEAAEGEVVEEELVSAPLPCLYPLGRALRRLAV